MKKTLALLVAFAAVISINVTAFAALSGVDVMPAIGWAADTTSNNPKISVEKDQLVLGISAAGGTIVVLPETFLTPGSEYSYQIFRVDRAEASIEPNNVQLTPVTDALLNGAKLKVRTGKGSANVVTAKIDKKGTGPSAIYNFVIKTKENFGTKVNDIEYSITATGQAATATNRLIDSQVIFQSGYRAMTDDELNSYGEGDIVTIMNDRPVITKDQFSTLAKANAYKPVMFTGEDGEWTFSTRVSGMGDANFLTTFEVVPEIIIQFPEQDYKFINFRAPITFPTSGEMRVEVSDLINSDIAGNNLYAYLYRDGALTPINSTFDSSSDELVFRTNFLGSFVITTEEITELAEPEVPETNENLPNNNNPQTGASAMGALIAFGAASALSAGAVIRRKKK